MKDKQNHWPTLQQWMAGESPRLLRGDPGLQALFGHLMPAGEWAPGETLGVAFRAGIIAERLRAENERKAQEVHAQITRWENPRNGEVEFTAKAFVARELLEKEEVDVIKDLVFQKICDAMGIRVERFLYDQTEKGAGKPPVAKVTRRGLGLEESGGQGPEDPRYP